MLAHFARHDGFKINQDVKLVTREAIRKLGRQLMTVWKMRIYIYIPDLFNPDRRDGACARQLRARAGRRWCKGESRAELAAEYDGVPRDISIDPLRGVGPDLSMMQRRRLFLGGVQPYRHPTHARLRRREEETRYDGRRDLYKHAKKEYHEINLRWTV